MPAPPYDLADLPLVFPTSTMHAQTVDMDEHAVLWPELTILFRHVEGREDITVGTHPVLGACIVSHHGFGPLVEWITRKPIPDTLTD